MTVVIETSRLRLSVPAVSDAEALWPIFCEPGVIEFVSSGPASSLDVMRRRLAKYRLQHKLHGYTYWTVAIKETGRLIGDAGLSRLPDSDDVEMGVRLSATVWDQAYGGEASIASMLYGFEVCQIPRIFSATRPKNRRARYGLEKLGFAFQGLGSYHGQYLAIYSVTRDAWRPPKDRLHTLGPAAELLSDDFLREG